MPPQIKAVGASSNIFFMLHSDPGAGKTVFIGSGGKTYKILIIRSPVDHTDPIIGSGVQEMVVRDHDDFAEASEYLRHEGNKWDWVWWDSSSLTQDVLLDDVYQGVLDSKGRPGSDARAHRARFGPDRGEYRINMWRIEEWVRYVVGAGGFNFGVTAHSFWGEIADKQEPGSTITKLMPWIQGKMMSEKICGMMNVVGYLDVQIRKVGEENRDVRTIHFNKNGVWMAKNQFLLPDGKPTIVKLANPTLPKFVEAISKGRLQTNEDRARGRTRPTGARPATRPKQQPVIRRRTKGAS